jgi:hypothetical protein
MRCSRHVLTDLCKSSDHDEGVAGGTRHYNGLQISVNRTLGNNLLVTGAYTYSGASSNGFGSINGTRQQSQRELEFAARINF